MRGRTRGPNLGPEIGPRFWPKVDRTDLFGCWEWNAYRNHNGYGELSDGIQIRHAHRVSWELHNGPIPRDMVVRHDCDNAGCVNPAHLRIGTHADNIADKVARNRQAKGEGNGRAVLTAADVLAIRRAFDAGEDPGLIAARYPVSKRAIVYIGQRVNWRHLEEAA